MSVILPLCQINFLVSQHSTGFSSFNSCGLLGSHQFTPISWDPAGTHRQLQENKTTVSLTPVPASCPESQLLYITHPTQYHFLNETSMINSHCASPAWLSLQSQVQSCPCSLGLSHNKSTLLVTANTTLQQLPNLLRIKSKICKGLYDLVLHNHLSG